MSSTTIAYIAALVLLVPGIAMATVPLLPALSYMFVVSLIFAVATGFAALSGKGLLVLLLITALSIGIDHTAGLLGAKYSGAHAKSVFWGFVGALAGTFVVPALGSFAGLFIGVLIAELYYKRHHGKALKAAGGALAGAFAGVVMNVILSVVFVAAFVFLAMPNR